MRPLVMQLAAGVHPVDAAGRPMPLEIVPIIVDPSHATGIARLVEPMALAATACGADGLIIETHNDPKHALCDGAQSLTLDEFAALMDDLRKIAPVVDRTL